MNAAAFLLVAVSAVRTVVDGSPLTFCLTTLGIASGLDLDLPRHVAPIALITVLSVSLAVTGLIGRRVAVLIRQTRRRGHEHAVAARIIGSQGASPDVVVIDVQQPAA